MQIPIEGKNEKGSITIADKVRGFGVIDSHSWCLSSSSTSLVLEITDDPAIEPEDLPLVGYGCSGWIFEREATFSKNEIMSVVLEGFSLFRSNSLQYVPAVNNSCSD